MTQEDLYKKSGVDIAKGDQLVDWLKADDSLKTSKYGAITKGVGGFAGLFQPQFKGMENPLLVSGTDGVGTKLLLGLEQNNLTGIGEDLVAMCVNDLYCVGATPLFFLDYFATGKLEDEQFKTILTSIKSGLRKCHTALLGGETAEMPGLYESGHFDLCGFVVGVVDEKDQLGPQRVEAGDRLIAIESSGFHSNGYSLIRSLIKENGPFSETFLSKALRPTQIYGQLPSIFSALTPEKFHALSNITGGGISGNLNRATPENMTAVVDGALIQTQGWVNEFLGTCSVNHMDVEKVLNLGVGMIAIVAEDAVKASLNALAKAGYKSYECGVVEAGGEGQVEYSRPIGA